MICSRLSAIVVYLYLCWWNIMSLKTFISCSHMSEYKEESERESGENRSRRGKEQNAERREGKHHAIIIWILGKIGHGKGENWIWERFQRSRESLNASNVKTMTDIKTDGNKYRPLWINHCCKISFRGSKSHLHQTNDRVRGLKQGVLSDGTILSLMEEVGCCFTQRKSIFLYAKLITDVFLIIVLTNGPNFWVRDISLACLFPEATFPQLSISPWCLKRGTTAVSMRPFRENSSADSSALKLT